MWMGVDVGARRKGFDVSVLDDELALIELRAHQDVGQVVELVTAHRPTVVGIDCPKVPAPLGARYRNDEMELRRAVCGIRWTPDLPSLQASDYFAWVLHGLELYAAAPGLRTPAVCCITCLSICM